ncbi:hypothetical protein L210DRAFT_939466 [Boletus edulis BED1]|uniref:Uncharacterized protein n=1 Tax=Boletus edulis BED1 TaxID=1328754 RepID=A0AAD4BAC5_BOLED|nr:hypothetical protein L210DRAFT_939466 [Boletus edulis BED1]
MSCRYWWMINDSEQRKTAGTIGWIFAGEQKGGTGALEEPGNCIDTPIISCLNVA